MLYASKLCSDGQGAVGRFSLLVVLLKLVPNIYRGTEHSFVHLSDTQTDDCK